MAIDLRKKEQKSNQIASPPDLSINLEREINRPGSRLEELLRKKIKEISDKEFKEKLQTSFTARKLTDTPTDNLSMVNRRFVTLNGVSASRPTGSILGQSYFDTTIGLPVWWNGTNWQDAAGNAV